MRSIAVAATLVAFWVQWSPLLRGWPAALGLRDRLRSRIRIAEPLSSATGAAWRVVARRVLRVLALALLLCAPVTLVALAYASPPDPSWISGIYDDADYDDIVARTVSASGDTAPSVPPTLRPHPPIVASLAPLTETGPSGPPSSAVHSRAPPAD